MAPTLILLTLLAAIADWIAVARRTSDPVSRAAKAAEYVAKPLTMLFLIGAALAIAHDHRAPGLHHAIPFITTVTVVALVLSTLGDVFLMLPDDSPSAERNFVAGLGSFLLAHVAYIVAFVRLRHGGGYAISFVLTGLVLAGAVFATVGLRIREGAKAEEPKLAGPVLAYVTVISAMMVAAWWTGDMRIIPGALLFAFSDALIGWTKFVRRDWELEVPIIVTYHLAQILLVLGLLRR